MGWGSIYRELMGSREAGAGLEGEKGGSRGVGVEVGREGEKRKEVEAQKQIGG